MHPAMLDQFAAERTTAKADDRRRARQARRTWQSRPSRLMTRFGLPRAHACPSGPQRTRSRHTRR